MSVDFIYRPLDHSTWVNDGRRNYKSCRFRSSYKNTMDLLRKELRALNVRRAVVETDITEGEIRLDGLPYANAKPRSPRVRLSFDLSGIGPVQYPCDTYDSWQDNVRAIAKTLEAQRAMDRYGATRHRQQYTGWKALPGGTTHEVAMTPTSAADLIVTMAGGIASEIVRDQGVYRTKYRMAVKACHPDTNGEGFTDSFKKLQEAKRVLDKHHAR